MAGPFRSIDFELFSQLEAAYGVSPGALAGADAFKCFAKVPFEQMIQRYDRARDQGNGASILSFQVGRKKSKWSVDGDVIPSGNAATPIAPDMDDFYKAHTGEKFTCTAHTTTAAGSAGVTLNLAGGGGAASGIRTGGGDIIVVDVDATNGKEARQVISRAVDVVTVDRAFTANPAAGRNVYVGTTYRLLYSSAFSLFLWEFLAGDNCRHAGGGCIVQNLGIDIDASSGAPVAGVKFSGEGKIFAAQTATSRPNPTTAGEPLLPTEGKVFIGASGKLCVVKAGLQSNNGQMLRETESCSLEPTGVKRTGNEGGRYKVDQTLDMLWTSGLVEGYYDNQMALTAYDVIVQLGVNPGNMVVWRTPKFVPEVPIVDAGGEVAISMKGKCYGLTVADTEFALAFI